jgi:predicted permease
MPKLGALDSILQDLRYAFRTLKKDAAFTTFAVLIVAFGIGASSTVFSVVNALLLRPLPFKDAERLVWVANADVAGLSGQTTQVGHYLDLKAQNQSYSEMAAYFAFYGIGDAKLTGAGEPERLTATPVSGDFFPVLGVQPILGRNFTDEECKWRGPRAVLLSYGLWRRRFASDPAIVGRALTIDEQPYTVAGVLPASFDFGSVFAPGLHVDLYTAFPTTPETHRWGNTLAIVARLKPGVTAAAAQAEARVFGRRNTEAHPQWNNFVGNVKPLAQHVSGKLRVAVLVLAGAVAVVMLIVCANLSNLLLARASARQKEIAVRTALGAGRGRLARQLFTESMALSCCGAAVGLGLALAGTRALSRLEAISLPLLREVRTDATALAFIVLMAIATGLVFGVGPALQTPVGALHESLKESTRGSTEGRRRSWARGALVVSEVAFACVLLVGAGLLIRSFLRVLDVDLGFRPESSAALRVDPGRQYDTLEKQVSYFNEVLRRVRETPGVVAAGITDALPLGRNRTWGLGAKGVQYQRGRYPLGYVRVISDGYFAAMGIPLRAGRDFTERDAPGTEPVIILNETMARSLWPGQDAIGQYIVNGRRELRVIGVVADVRHLALEQASGNEFYLSLRQGLDRSSADLVVRTTLPVATLASTVRNALKPLQPDLPGNDFRTIQGLVDKSVSPRRFVALLLAGFATFALVLASLGIYGVVSYSVGQRAQEIGIRMALGASAGQLQRRIVLQTLGLAAIGMTIGAVGAWLLARAMGSLLFGLTASDPATFAGMVAVLTAVASVAGYLPARRASRMDPMAALRAE